MFKNLKNKTGIKIAGATMTIIFSLAATFSGTIAWFNITKSQTITGQAFTISQNAIVKTIYILPYLGKTSGEQTLAFTFDLDNAQTAYSKETGYNSCADNINLNPFSMENPDHPVMMLFEVEGDSTNISFSTDYCFLGTNKSDIIEQKTASKQALDQLIKTPGKYYEVNKDETLSNVNSLYYYDGSSLINRTYSTKTNLDDASKVNGYYRVTTDNDHNNVSTIYKYNSLNNELEMVWIDLAPKPTMNPLSSVVDFHYYSLEGEDLNSLKGTHNVNVESYDGNTGTYSYNEQSKSCLAISKNTMTIDNKKSFANFEDTNNYEYINNVQFNIGVQGLNYFGIVINYNASALQYVFSANLGHGALNSGLSFRCDWKTGV